MIKLHCNSIRDNVDARCEPLKPVDVVAAVRERIECLTLVEHCSKLEIDVKKTYEDIFQPLPHVDEMPDRVTCKIELKNAEKTITGRSYACPRKIPTSMADPDKAAPRCRPYPRVIFSTCISVLPDTKT